jgi:endonuclease/exonuclease/phosphatase family metal-dependent hydrolase
MVRIVSFNVENLFARATAFDKSDVDDNAPILAAYKRLNELFAKEAYSPSDKAKMIELLVELDIYYVNQHGVARRRSSLSPQWAWLRANRGKFDREPQDTTEGMEIIATGRSSWIGWVDLATEAVNEIGTRMTAQVIRDLKPDILGVVEAESRPSLLRFNRELLGDQFHHVMLVDGNDDRGIDVGLMTTADNPIGKVRSNVDLADAEGLIFSRDCPQYEVTTKKGNVLHVLVNHFKSQSNGGGEKRFRQATAVRAIVETLVDAGEHVVLLGDLNEGPKAGKPHADNLAPLYTGASPLVECYDLPSFDVGPKPGTYDGQGLSNRLDYIFVSKSLEAHVKKGGVFRKGVWGSRKTKPTDWEVYDAITSQAEQASDHAAIFLDLDGI